ncbi:hypothetical protein J4Q44_G00179130 [Coregonus suidteri]|uniref:Uncharacterized protein n=1 Tax=Coregonus suidteri TaxID=861788 RepID=A0AAN8LMD7_9TELE
MEFDCKRSRISSFLEAQRSKISLPSPNPNHLSGQRPKHNNGNVFRRNLLNRLQLEFVAREETRLRSLQEWVCFVTFICNVFDYLKVNNMPMVALVHPVLTACLRLAQPDSLNNEEEVDCLVLQLHRIGTSWRR